MSRSAQVMAYAMVPMPIQQALVGLGGGLVYASWKLRDDLCAGEAIPTRRQTLAAWGQFVNFLFAAPLLAGTFTQPLMNKFGTWATWPMIAVFIGLSGNLLWPIVLKGFSQETALWLKGIFIAIRGGRSG
jgi:hypothetical protein